VAFDVRPMLASLTDASLADPQFVYEPKYDGIRAIAEIAPKGRTRLWSRLGNEKTHQFPEVVAALESWARRRTTPLVLDGEIVALDGDGKPAGFQQLQGRIHLREPGRSSVALIVFDLLHDGTTDYRRRPLTERRAALERLMTRTNDIIRISRQVRGDGRALYEQALAEGWEGLIAKHAASLYQSGKRTPDWRKIKILHEQEFVIGGWTEPRETRTYFGALIVGVYGVASRRSSVSSRREPPGPSPQPLIYVGHIGTGFNERELARVMALLKPLEIKTSPFVSTPKTNERPHWVRPELVAQVTFTEWTTDGKLRHPVYLGLRDDKKAADVRREEAPHVRTASKKTTTRKPAAAADTASLIDQLTELERARKDGVLALPGGDELKITNLHKPFWPKLKLTKGDLFRYYVRASPFLLPVIADRPLVMKRFPNGVDGPPFYQHRAPDVPAGIRTAVVSVVEERPQIVGGDLKTLLYTTQLAAISQDPWFSRVAHVEFADYSAFDLDPADGVPFTQVLDVARWIRDELDALGAHGLAKTSGADGLHIYIPLPPGTPYDAGLLFCQIVATLVERKHPKSATTERAVRARGKRVYIDCLQNILGKTLATAYSARASDYAGVSTPVAWQEVDEGLDRRDFTIVSVPDRLKSVGDLWAALRKSKGVDLARATRAVTSTSKKKR
jgi:bifunctional non-homologous end joining protein LigD